MSEAPRAWQIIYALGGATRVAKDLGVGASIVHRWVGRDEIPTAWVPALRSLAKRNFETADKGLACIADRDEANDVRMLIASLGGPTHVAKRLNLTKQAVLYWCKQGVVPARQQVRLAELAAHRGIAVSTFGISTVAA